MAACTSPVRLITPGAWGLDISETGPFGPSGASPVTARAQVSAVTAPVDHAIASSTDDLWEPGKSFTHFLYLPPGASGVITLRLTPTAEPGTTVSGDVYLDDFFLASEFTSAMPTGDEVAALPYHYTVAPENRPRTGATAVPAVN